MQRREFIRVGGAALVCSGTAFWAGRVSRFTPSRYVQLGTSLTAGSGTKLGGMIPAMVANKLGMNSSGINGGLPGSCAGDHKFPSMNSLSLFSIVDAIVHNDWSSYSGKTGNLLRDYAISQLMTVRFDTVTHMGLEYGPNDFRYDRPLGSDFHSGRETFKGALNHSVQALLHRYPHIRVFLMTPWWMPTLDGRDSDQHPNELGVFLREYVAAIQRVAEINRIPCLDLWSTSGVTKMNVEKFTAGDSTHLNDNGAIRRADMIANFMRTIF
jgi:GDSL-like lipase/acylhydrolase family protein